MWDTSVSVWVDVFIKAENGKNDTDLEITQVILMQLHVFMHFKLNRPIHLNSPRDNWGVEVRDYHVWHNKDFSQ